MKSYLKIFLLPSFFLLFMGAIIPKDSPVLRPGKDYALFFAINDYDEWRDLRYPISEAEEIAADLRQHYGFEVEIVRNPDKREILLKLQEYRRRTYASDAQLLIYFTGHGFFIEDTEEGFIIPSDGQTNDLIQESYIPHSRLEKAIDNIPCKHILLCIDACFSGTFDEVIASKGGLGERPRGGKNENELFIQRSLQYQGRQYLTSGGKEQTPDRSKFALQLKLALRTFGGADGILTVNEIETFLEKVYPIPRSGYFGDHEGGNFLFITNDYNSSSAEGTITSRDRPDPVRQNTLEGSSSSTFPRKGTATLGGQRYSAIQFNPGGLTWMTQNLNIDVPDSWCYDDEPANCSKYGRLYTWEAAKRACASLGQGWRLPTDEEWEELARKFGGYYDWQKEKDVGDPKASYKALLEGGNSGFNARLGGWRYSSGSFYGLGDHGVYWSAREYTSDSAWGYRFDRSSGELVRDWTTKSGGPSCRCVQGAPSNGND